MSVLPVGFGSAVAGGYQIERSLRFNSADSAYLNRTLTTPTDGKRWTWSGWVKRTTLGTTLNLFTAGAATGIFRFTSTDTLLSGWTGAANLETTQVFRDVSAWYHIVLSVDTTQATAANRVKYYVNGSQITAFSSTDYPTQNSATTINSAVAHNIGAYQSSSQYANCYMTEINFIDGQALTPSSFGETDTNTGVWKPKAYTGTYGTNGFYLPFKTASQWSGYFDGTGDSLTSSTNAIAATGEFSVEAWVYQIARTVTSDQHIFSQYTSGATAGRWYLRFNGTTVAFTTGLGTSVSCATTVNTGTWYHVCVTRDSSNRVRVFLNGVLDGTAVISGSLDTAASVIGATQTANYWQGYISNVRAVSGEIPTAYQTASTTVGATIFTPSTSQLTAVSGTSLLTCQSSTFIDNSGLGRTITTAGDTRPQQFSPFTLDVTDDHSGTGNHWQPNNLDLRTTGVGADILVDSPTAYGTDTGVGGEVRGNYATWNPLDSSGNTLANGNLQVTEAGSSYNQTLSTQTIDYKTYAEFTLATLSGQIGVQSGARNDSGSGGLSGMTIGYNTTTSGSYAAGEVNTAGSATGTTYTAPSTNNVFMIAVDPSNGKVWMGLQGTWFNSGNPAAGTGEVGTISTSNILRFAFGRLAAGGGVVYANFGQRPFAYTAPSGFKALCTQNLP